MLPTWMRRALLATAAMNLLGAALFLPSAASLRALAGLPPGESPLYLGMVSMFVLLFGAGYLWAGLSGRVERLFITISAVGKLGFFSLLIWFWAAGALPFRAVLFGAGDLFFGLLFVVWLVGAAAAEPSTAATAARRTA